MSVLTVERRAGVATVTLCRPEALNALNAELIDALTETFQALAADDAVRSVVLAGAGRTFCAGGDLRWMQAGAAAPFDENLAGATRLAKMLAAIYGCPRPVIARVHGGAFGGGAGLVAACDFAAAVEGTQFCFSEVRLGLVPAVISCFVVRRIGSGAARRYFLTAERFDAAEARRIGLVAEVAADTDALDARVARWTEALAENGPEALAACKAALDEALLPVDQALPRMARRLAERRAGAEGREGVQAFLEKRLPTWRQPADYADDLSGGPDSG